MSSFEDSYELVEQIGMGTTGKVFKAREKLTGHLVAVKIISKNGPLSMAKRSIELLPRLMLIDHIFIIHYYEWFEDSDNLYVVMEYVSNGSLLDFINSQGKLNDEQIKVYMLQMIDIMEFLHKEVKVIHRDLKAENFLVDQFNNLRLNDFGFAKFFEDDDYKKKTICGSPVYAAPEMIMKCNYTSKVDIWSMGVILYAMATGKLPYRPTNMAQMLISEPSYDFQANPLLVDLIKRMLTKDPEERISLNEIRKHPFMIQKTLPRVKVSDPNCITPTVILKMKNSKVDSTNIVENLKNNTVNHSTAVYKMLNTDFELNSLMSNSECPRVFRDKSKIHIQANSALAQSSAQSSNKRRALRMNTSITKSSPAVLKLISHATHVNSAQNNPNPRNDGEHQNVAFNQINQSMNISPTLVIPHIRHRTLLNTPKIRTKCLTPLLIRD